MLWILFKLILTLVVVVNVVLFLWLMYHKVTTPVSHSRHRHPGNIRRRRGDAPEIITTGDIYAIYRANDNYRPDRFGDSNEETLGVH